MYEFNSKKSTNKVVLLINWLLDFFLIGGYLVEYLKGGKTLGFVLAFMGVILVPMITATVYYKNKNDSDKVKYITIFGYFIIYAMAMFTSARLLTYAFVFPIIAMYLLYFDLKLMIAANVVIFIMNIGKVFYNVVILNLKTPEMTTDYTIQMSSIILYGISLIIATGLSNRFNDEKLKSIADENKKTESILKEVLNIATILDKNSKSVFEIVKELKESTNVITDSVNNIADDSYETLKSVEEQISLTNDIHKVISNASELSKNMETISKDTTESVRNGLSTVNELEDKANIVNNNSNKVYIQMTELRDYANEIFRITEMITDISEQTKLLSLNASIESARVGEIGKGFAVVADEVGKLALQSKNAAEEISNMIIKLQEKANISVESVKELNEANKEEDKYIRNTKMIFTGITEKINMIDTNTKNVYSVIQEILSSSNQIIDKSNKLAEISKNTADLSMNAKEITSGNIEQVERVKTLVESLANTTDNIDKYL